MQEITNVLKGLSSSIAKIKVLQVLSLLIARISLGHPHGLSPGAHAAELANALVYLSATPEGREGHFLFNSLAAPVFISPHFALSHRVRPAHDKGLGPQSGCRGHMPGLRAPC